MKVVVDTNVIVAGLLSPFGPCSEILRMISGGLLTVCLDARILSEYKAVLARKKFNFDRNKTSALLDYIEHEGHLVASTPLAESLLDPDDNPFYEVAIAGQAVCLITGNISHFPEALCQAIPVLVPREFLSLYARLYARKVR